MNVCLVTAVALTALMDATKSEIRLTVTPSVTVYHHPSYVLASYWIQKHEANRFQSLVWDSETGKSGSLTRSMDGQYAPERFETLIEVTPGDYRVTACAYRTPPVKFCDRREVFVSGEGE